MARFRTSQTVNTLARIPLAACYFAMICGAGVGAAAGFNTPEDDLGLSFYGQINKGILTYDDGFTRQTYAPVDNANSGTRLGFRSETGLSQGNEVFTNFELGLTKGSTSSVNIANPTDSNYSLDKTAIRKLEIRISGADWGRVWLGQGSMATDGIAENDLSGTGVVAGSSVSDLAGGQHWRLKDGSLSLRSIKSNFSNMDGGRRFRLRYDTPAFHGISLSGAVGREVLADFNDREYQDVALRFQRDAGEIRLVAGIGYRWQDHVAQGWAGSVAVSHSSSGLSLMASGGAAPTGRNTGYFKLGWERDFFTIGSTAISVDYSKATGIPVAGSDSRSFGLAFVQSVDRANLEFYTAFRNYSASEPAQDTLGGQAMLSGLRWRF